MCSIFADGDVGCDVGCDVAAMWVVVCRVRLAGAAMHAKAARFAEDRIMKNAGQELNGHENVYDSPELMLNY